MAPSEKAITSALRAAVLNIFNSDQREDLSVNLVRKTVEEETDLEEGFLQGPQWKAKSKQIILEENNRLLDAEEKSAAVKSSPSHAEPKPTHTTKSKAESERGVKRASNGEAAKPRKRQKKEDTPEKGLESDSPLSEMPDSFKDGSDSPKPKKEKNVAPKAVPKRERKSKVEPKAKAESDDEEANGSPPARLKPDPASRKPKQELKVDVKHESKSRPKLEDSDNKDIKPKEDPNVSDIKPSLKKSPESKSAIKAGSDSDSEMSVVYDEAPKPKPAKSSKPKSSTTKTSTSSKPKPPDLSPAETEIKTLQSRLLKCGVRKIWAFELKTYGDDAQAKIRHLEAMLRELGMGPRFSDAKAKEIKEARELEADLEAVTEGAKMWGKGREGLKKEKEKVKVKEEERGTRALGKGREKVEKESKVEERIVRAKQELAFLGDEESDSD